MKVNLKLLLLYSVTRYVLTEFYVIHTEDFENEHVIKRITNTIRTECYMECRNNKECHDVRFLLESQHVGECVLLKEPNTFKTPLCNVATSQQSMVEKHGHKCLCPTGFEGNRCETFTGLGSSKVSPASSCIAIKEMYPYVVNGLYWVMLTMAVNVYCDMETLGGGWLLFGGAKYNESSQHVKYGYEKIGSDDLSKLYNAALGKFLLTTNGLQNLQTLINFTQIQFYCYKPSVGRTMHIATTSDDKGYAVIDYFLRRTAGRPSGCGSFIMLQDDTSALSKNCQNWAKGQWGADLPITVSLYDHLAYVYVKYHVNLIVNRKECDDFGSTTPGEWKYFAR